MRIKKKRVTTFVVRGQSLLLALLVLTFSLVTLSTERVDAISTLNEFNNTSDLTDLFNNDGSPVFTNISNGGINNTGSVNVPIPSNDLWITKQGYSVSGAAGSVYTFSAYFLVAQNSGYGNLGFTNVTSANGDSYGQPATGIGVNFHGGGGGFFNNGSQTALSWPPDLVLGNWYYFKFEVTTKGSNQFDLKLQIWNTDSTGVLGSMKTEKTQNNVTNNTMGSAPIIYAFFGAAGSRMEKIDNFAMNLTGSTFIEAGAPVVLSNSNATSVTSTSASFGGNVTSDQGSAVTARGTCWSTSVNPTTGGSCSSDGTGTGTFTSSLAGLATSTTYYVRAFATNSQGTTYGAETSFTTSAPTYDSDGIDNTVENSSPNSGDANSDGTPDNQQENVASLLNSVTGKYTTIEASGCGGSNALSSVSASSESNDNKDSKYNYPAGLASFTVTCGTPGATSTITQYYYGNYNPSDYVLRKYSANSQSYQTVAGATFSSVIIGGQPALKVVYSITDGGIYDDDGTANGTIVDPAGPAQLTAGTSTTGSNSSTAPNTGLKRISLVPFAIAILLGVSTMVSIAFTVGRQTRNT